MHNYIFFLQTNLFIMRIITPPSKLGLFQLLVACLLVALFTSPGDAHMGPMLMFKGGHGHGGGGGGAAAILAAGLVIHLLSHLKKSHGGDGYSGGGSHGSGHGHSMGGGHGMMAMMGEGHGYGMEGYGMAHSFASHDEHLMDYGYEPQGHAWSK